MNSIHPSRPMPARPSKQCHSPNTGFNKCFYMSSVQMLREFVMEFQVRTSSPICCTKITNRFAWAQSPGQTFDRTTCASA
jgi:hypothetical protein